MVRSISHGFADNAYHVVYDSEYFSIILFAILHIHTEKQINAALLFPSINKFGKKTESLCHCKVY